MEIAAKLARPAYAKFDNRLQVQTSGAVWDLEDTEALAAAKRLIERNSQRQTKEMNNSSQLTAAR